MGVYNYTKDGTQSMTPRSDKFLRILVTAWLWALILPLAQAEEGDIVLGRDVPARIAYRDAPPGQAMTASASPRPQIYQALGIGNGKSGTLAGLGRELSAAEIDAVSAGVAPIQGGGSLSATFLQAGLVGPGTTSQAVANGTQGGPSAGAGGIASTVTGATSGIGAAITGALAPLGNLK